MLVRSISSSTRRRRVPILLGCLVAGFICLSAPASSTAVVTLGSDLSKPPISSWGCAGQACTGTQVSLPGRLTVSPVSGTITTFRIRGAAGGADTGRLRVLAPMGVPLLFKSASTTVTVPAGTTTSTFATSLPISSGDRIGLDDDHLAGSNFGDAGAPGGPVDLFQPIPANGTMRNPDFATTGELLFNADIVPTSLFPKPRKPKTTKKGIAFLVVTAPNPGLLTIGAANATGASVAAKGSFVRPVSTTVAAAGDINVKLRPSKSTKTILRRFGKASGQVKVTFTPTGGTPASQLLRIRLKLG
jgi:hypothetical protein